MSLNGRYNQHTFFKGFAEGVAEKLFRFGGKLKGQPSDKQGISALPGIEVCRLGGLLHNLDEEIVVVSPREWLVAEERFLVFSEALLVERVAAWHRATAQQFAADCVEHVLHLFEGDCVDEKRTWEVLGHLRSGGPPSVNISFLRKYCKTQYPTYWVCRALSAAVEGTLPLITRSKSGHFASRAAMYARQAVLCVNYGERPRGEEKWQRCRLGRYLGYTGCEID